MKDSLEELNKTITVLEEKMKAAVEDNIKLEQYTRRDNLRFNNVMEEEGGDCKSLIYEVIEKVMGIDTANTKFHAVHRVGKKMESRCRPIIAPFVSREDRNQIWQNRGKIKQKQLGSPDVLFTGSRFARTKSRFARSMKSFRPRVENKSFSIGNI